MGNLITKTGSLIWNNLLNQLNDQVTLDNSTGKFLYKAIDGALAAVYTIIQYIVGDGNGSLDDTVDPAFVTPAPSMSIIDIPCIYFNGVKEYADVAFTDDFGSNIVEVN